MSRRRSLPFIQPKVPEGRAGGDARVPCGARAARPSFSSPPQTLHRPWRRECLCGQVLCAAHRYTGVALVIGVHTASASCVWTSTCAWAPFTLRGDPDQHPPPTPLRKQLKRVSRVSSSDPTRKRGSPSSHPGNLISSREFPWGRQKRPGGGAGEAHWDPG